MAWQATPYAIPLFLAFAMAGGLGLYAAFGAQGSDRGLRASFLAMVSSAGLWSAAYGLQLASTTLADKLLWNRFVWVGVAGLAVAWPLFVLTYVGYRDWLESNRIALLAAVPASVLAVVWTGGSVPFVYASVELTTVGDTLVLGPQPGPLFGAFILYSYSVNAVTFALLGITAVRRRGVFRRQALLLLFAGMLPMAVGIVGMLGIDGITPVDLTPVTFVVTTLVVAWVLFDYRLLELAPMARDTVFAELDDAIVLVDATGTIIDANDAARRLFDTEHLLGASVETAFDAYPSIRRALETPESAESHELTLESGDGTGVFLVTTSTLGQREVDGIVVFVREITERHRYEQRLQVLNRVLRHDLKNDVNVISGYTDLLRPFIEDPVAVGYLDVIDQRAQSIAHLGEQARDVDSAIHSDARRTRIDLTSLVSELTAQYADEYPAADIEMDVAASAPILADPLLETAVSNVLENAITHHDGENPLIRVTVSTSEDDCVLVVTDDGPGIPPEELAVITNGEETPLQHASGLGLWLVHWIVAESGGEVSIDSRDSRGTCVTLRFPRADPES